MLFLIIGLLCSPAFFMTAMGQCTLPDCEKGAKCYSSTTAALECLYSIPWNQAWANQTIEVLSQSLENFGFDALYHSTGPPYSINLDIVGELSAARQMVISNEFSTDLDFQEYVQSIFQKMIDAHTRYQKPVCYNVIFVQPFSFDMRESIKGDGISDEPVVYIMRNLYTDQYKEMFPGLPIDELIGRQITLLDGVELTTAVSQWGDSHETRSNNRGIRFNAAIRSYLYRSAISVTILPIEDLQITLSNGDVYILPWMASYTTGFANVAVCAAVPASSTSLSTSTSSSTSPTSTSTATSTTTSSFRGAVPYGIDQQLINQPKESRTGPRPMYHTEDSPPQLLVHERLHDSRPDRETIVPTNSKFYVSCFIQTVTGSNADEADVSKVLVMKVASFSPPGNDYLVAWAGFLDEVQQCLTVEFDMIVVDVMQNGGGYVCLGLRLLELLIEEYEDDHTLVQMVYDLPHSPLMDKYIEVVNSPDPYPIPKDVEQILNRDTQKPFVDGHAYYYPGRNVTQGGVISWRTNEFSLDCKEAEALPANGFRPEKFMPPDKLIILTDGTCGSTCASFTKIPQEHGKATFVGAGGLWNQPMDVSSFAGGFVCNPGYLANIANWSGAPAFPQFFTNQHWQFGWATWYSSKLPSRQAQFTEQQPDYRQPFWGFPHVSVDANITTAMVSVLYDKVIASQIAVIAVSALPSATSCSNHLMSDFWIYALIAVSAILAALVITGGVYIQHLQRTGKERYHSVSKEDDLQSRLVEEE